MEAETGLPYRDIGALDLILIAAFGLPAFLYFLWQGEEVRGLVAGMSLACVAGQVSVLWPLVRNARFWAVLVLVSLFHALLVYLLPPSTAEVRFAYALLPIFFLDWYVCARIIIFACAARLPRNG